MTKTASWIKATTVAVTLAALVGCSPAQEETKTEEAATAPVTVEKTQEEIAAERKAKEVAAAKEAVMTVGEVVYFGFDDAEIQPEAIGILNDWAKYLTLTGDKAIIQGHTDERGSREYNISLGERRAKAVIGYLVSQGVDAGQLEAVSFGEESPAVDGSNEYAWSKNRRAVLEL